MQDALLAYERRDELGGGHVERRIAHAHARRGPAQVAVPGDLVRGAPLDGDAGSVGDAAIEGGERGGDIEREAVAPREHREAVGADLVGDVAVGGNAIGADDDYVHFAAAHQVEIGRAHV